MIEKKVTIKNAAQVLDTNALQSFDFPINCVFNLNNTTYTVIEERKDINDEWRMLKSNEGNHYFLLSMLRTDAQSDPSFQILSK